MTESIQSNTVKSIIESRLLTAFPDNFFQVENESHQHNVPKNSETHFKLTLVSEQFDGVRKVARHQQLYKLLNDLMQNPIHALALHLYAPDEWEGDIPESPKCMGGSKK